VSEASSCMASSNPVDLGWWAARTRLSAVGDGRGTLGRFLIAGLGGHGEGLRRSRDDAAGVQPGADPVDRRSVNVGTVHVAFRGHRPAGTDDRGLARRLFKGVCGAEPL
jgi:hypothetical protein